MSETALRSALIVPVHSASALVDEWRERTCHAKPSTGVPAHVTVLWPFVEASMLGAAIVEDLRRLFDVVDSFRFELRATARFPATLYLAPEPADPFVELTRAVHRAHPAYPPYGGEFDELVPHLTPRRATAIRSTRPSGQSAQGFP